MGARRRWDPYSNTMHAVDQDTYFVITEYFSSIIPISSRIHCYRVELGGCFREHWTDAAGATIAEAVSRPTPPRIWETLKVREDYLEAYYD